MVLTEGEEGMVTDLINEGDLEFEYEEDKNSKKIVLGKGTYGIVYAARLVFHIIKQKRNFFSHYLETATRTDEWQ